MPEKRQYFPVAYFLHTDLHTQTPEVQADFRNAAVPGNLRKRDTVLRICKGLGFWAERAGYDTKYDRIVDDRLVRCYVLAEQQRRVAAVTARGYVMLFVQFPDPVHGATPPDIGDGAAPSRAYSALQELVRAIDAGGDLREALDNARTVLASRTNAVDS